MNTASLAAAGLNAAQLDRIRTHLEERYLKPGKVAGFLPLVYRRGEIAYCEPMGLMDIERGKPVREDTIWRIYSMSKPITSVALMQLYEQGHFQLSDAVDRWLPEFRDLRVYRSGVYPNFLTDPCERRMTVKDLLTHMSGLTYDFMVATNVDAAYRKAGVRLEKKSGTLDDMAHILSRLPLEFSPGTSWNYSVATDVCGLLVQRMSGQRFDEYLQEHLFGPLGMVDTGFSVPEDKLDRFAANYQRGPDKGLQLIDDPMDSPYGGEVTFFSGGGGLVSTAHDYLRFCRMLLGGGTLDGVRVMGRKTIELMSANHLPNGDDLTKWARGTFSETTYEGYGFGLGFSVNLGPGPTATAGSLGEIAWGGAASTIFWVDPAEDLAVILMTQFMPSGTFNFRGQMKSLVYPAIEPE
ncbi:MAG: serine hydrolase domain-containing protein [Pseudomonadales bacterium]|jgi:CubicO group peptidase (beta-lactamase class C family)|nr:serine hydrolase domain-containing protein [Pseudomonadales bacterium]